VFSFCPYSGQILKSNCHRVKGHERPIPDPFPSGKDLNEYQGYYYRHYLHHLIIKFQYDVNFSIIY